MSQRQTEGEVMEEIAGEKLATFNGTEGKPAYVALGGKIYDISKSPLWPKGVHMKRHPAGKDLTGEISAAPHGPEVLERYPQVGILLKGPQAELKHLPPMVQEFIQKYPMMRRHLHPSLVHFPIALLMASTLFSLLRLFFGNPSFEAASFYLLVLGGISSPFAIATGVLTWWINYQLKLTYFVKRKIQFSILLLILEIILIFWRSSTPEILGQKGYPLYFIMILALTPVVFLLAYYGGQMTFPTERHGA